LSLVFLIIRKNPRLTEGPEVVCVDWIFLHIPYDSTKSEDNWVTRLKVLRLRSSSYSNRL